MGNATLPPDPRRGKPPPESAMPFDARRVVSAVLSDGEKQGLAAADLARLAGVSRATISRAKSRPGITADVLAKLLAAAGRSWGWLDAVAPLDQISPADRHARPPRRGSDRKAKAVELRRAGKSVAEIAAALGVTVQTAYTYVVGVRPAKGST